MNIVIPMAGEGSRFAEAGYEKPKPFIDVMGMCMIERVIQNLNFPKANYILIARKAHLEAEKKTVKALSKKYPSLSWITIDQKTEGTACTVLFAREKINSSTPLLIANSDQLVDINISDFISDCKKRKLDGNILTFTDSELNPKWSFARIDKNKLVKEVQEKKPISKYATVGIYYFSRGQDFVNGAIDMIARNERVNNEFYTCPVYNYLIRAGKKIGIYNIKESEMHGTGTPADLDKYLEFLQK